MSTSCLVQKRPLFRTSRVIDWSDQWCGRLGTRQVRQQGYGFAAVSESRMDGYLIAVVEFSGQQFYMSFGLHTAPLKKSLGGIYLLLRRTVVFLLVVCV